MAYQSQLPYKPDDPWQLQRTDAHTLKVKLLKKLREYPEVEFDHVEVGYSGRNIVAVFVCEGKQASVQYDKTKGFPSAKLLASLVLLGSR